MSTACFTVYILRDESGKREEMLRYAASLYSGLDRSLFKKAVDEKGKPYFVGLENVSFSISHSGVYWACAFGTEKVGLDLQKHDECRRESITNRFFHKTEKDYLKDKCYAVEHFFDIWVKKESYIKFVGEGLSLGLDSFSVLKNPKNCEIKTLVFKDGYSLCICAKAIEHVKLIILD